jgi:ABC-type transport system substrate-binding protein
MRRTARIIALCLGAILCMCGCDAPDPQPSPSDTPAPTATAAPQAVRFSLGYDPGASLHPITGDSQVNQELTGLVYQGLYELDNTFTPQPVLARSASVSEDGLVWTISLAAGAVFSDGTPLTAQIAAASLEQARTSPLYAARLAQVAAVTAGEDGTVSIFLSAPNGNLSALLDVPIVLEHEGEGDLHAPLGTGYYRYELAGDRLYLQPNPYHTASAALPYSTIPLTPASDSAGRIAAFDSGDITAVTTDFSSPYALGYSSSYETSDYPTTTLLYVGFRASGGPCQSAPVRRAFSMVLDREELVRIELSGHGDPSALPVSPLCGDYSETAAALLAYDTQAAALLLEEAGYVRNPEDGLLYRGQNPLEVTLLVNSDNDVRQGIAARMSETLTGLGAAVTMTRLPWSDFTAALAAGQFDLYIGEVRLPGDFDPSALITGALNYGGFYSGELTLALAQWRSAAGNARTQAAQALWEEFAQSAPLSPLCFKRGSLLMRWGIASNLQPTRANPFYQIERWTIAG